MDREGRNMGERGPQPGKVDVFGTSQEQPGLSLSFEAASYSGKVGGQMAVVFWSAIFTTFASNNSCLPATNNSQFH